MARRLGPTFIPSTSEGQTVLPLHLVPQEVKDEVEEMYNALAGGTKGRFRVEFDSKTGLDQYAAQLAGYCFHRPAGRIMFRRSPVKDLPEGTMEFRIMDLPAEPTEKKEKAATPAEPTEEKEKAAAPAETPATPVKKTTGGRAGK